MNSSLPPKSGSAEHKLNLPTHDVRRRNRHVTSPETPLSRLAHLLEATGSPDNSR